MEFAGWLKALIDGKNVKLQQLSVATGLMYAYLTRRAGRARPQDADQVRAALRPRRPDARRERAARRAEAEKQLAQIPLMETNYQAQQAMGLMTLDKLAATLAALRAREEVLRALVEELAGDPPPEELAPVDALRLLRLLQDDSAPVLARRDALAAVFARLIPSVDRRHLTVHMR